MVSFNTIKNMEQNNVYNQKLKKHDKNWNIL